MRSPMLIDFPLSFREFAMATELSLADIHRQVMKFLQQRSDVALFGAQAVNVYVDVPRMTQDVDVMALSGEEFSKELCSFLHDSMGIPVRVRTVASGKGFRIYQLIAPSNRHLVDVRQVSELPPCQAVDGILVVQPAELMALKLVSMSMRTNTPKGLTDQADLMRLVLAFPEHRSIDGIVSIALQKLAAPAQAYDAWKSLVENVVLPDTDDDY